MSPRSLRNMTMVGLAAAASAVTGSASATATVPESAPARSEALVLTPAVDFGTPAPFFTARAGARVEASRAATTVPLPDGGNLNGIRWELAGGVVSRTEIQGVVEYNAACQWYRAFRDGRQADDAAAVLD
ncbi:MAG: hypothetical protein QOJ29_1516, partial [Thermoleophilaceae bacterium]|nr:hypothetical protein [Thermoleophilaceae bacterium]